MSAPVDQTYPYWCGRLSAAITYSLPYITERPKDARADLRSTLNEYLRSPLASPELRAALKEKR